jgi:hypothetical protein
VRTVTVALDSEGSRFVAQGSLRGQPININAPRLPGDRRGPTGFSATELLLAAAGSCAACRIFPGTTAIHLTAC